MTKINIISGFLGAGKTTLIQKLLKEVWKGEKVVLIENEFGEIGIDGGFLKEAGIEITEMNSGCICCSLVGDFGEALKKVIDTYHPDRVLIEPSGVGKLSDVIKAVQNIQKDLEEVVLDSFVTVADGTKCKMYIKNFGEFYNNQIEHASTIILSRTQKMKQEKLEEIVKLLKEHNKEAVIITTPWDELSGMQILSAMQHTKSLAEELLEEEEICPSCGHHHEHGEDCHDHKHEHGEDCHHHEHEHEDGEDCHHHEHEHGEDCHHHEHEHEHGEECHDHKHEHGEDCHHHEHGHHHADEVFTSWGVETPHQYTKQEMEEILKTLSNNEEYGMILRAKGIVPSTDQSWIYFDLVPGEYELREGSPEYTGRLCVIGTDLKTKELERLFHI